MQERSDKMGETETSQENHMKRLLREAADRFDIPLEEMERRLREFLDRTPESQLTREELQKRKAEAFARFPSSRGRAAPALKVTVSLNDQEARKFTMLKEQTGAISNTEVFRRLLVASEQFRPQTSEDLEKDNLVVRVRGDFSTSPTWKVIEVEAFDDLKKVARIRKVPILEVTSKAEASRGFWVIDSFSGPVYHWIGSKTGQRTP
jgi:hypothetical protein